MNISFSDCFLRYICNYLTCNLFTLGLCLFQRFLCSLITWAIPRLYSTPGVNTFTLLCVRVYKRVSPLWFVLNLKLEVTINGSDYFLAVSYWLSLSLVSELLSQGSASRVETEAGEQARRWGGAAEKLDMSLAVYLKASWTKCIWRKTIKRNLQFRVENQRGWNNYYQWCQNWDSFSPKRFISTMIVVPSDLFWSPKLFH